MIIAEYERYDKKTQSWVDVQIMSDDGELFNIRDDSTVVQENKSYFDVIRYLANALHNVNQQYGLTFEDDD